MSILVMLGLQPRIAYRHAAALLIKLGAFGNRSSGRGL